MLNEVTIMIDKAQLGRIVRNKIALNN